MSMTRNLEDRLQQVWYGNRPPALWMRLLTPVYRLLSGLRRWFYSIGLLRRQRLPIPVIVVGNLTVGGSGKSPLVMALATELTSKGYHPGVVSRGYGSTAGRGPLEVHAKTRPEDCGDEPLMIHLQSGVPVVVGARRVDCAERLRDLGCDLVISDDGLQHHALGRDIEIVVVDGERGFGNGRLLPAGPLRENPERLDQVDFVVYQGGNGGEYIMRLGNDRLRRIDGSEARLDPTEFSGRQVHALAGIAHPERYFRRLEGHGMQVQRHTFPDHHRYQPDDVAAFRQETVVMTAKDAVKCRDLGLEDAWVLQVEAQLPDAFYIELVDRLQGLRESPA